MTLEQKFHRESISGCEELRKEHGYNPTYWVRMVHEHGAVQAAKLLLRASNAQEGLFRLWELKRLDMSIEAMVIDPQYGSLFSEEERKLARKRLDDLGFL
jgi:hypothetical protein